MYWLKTVSTKYVNFSFPKPLCHSFPSSSHHPMVESPRLVDSQTSVRRRGDGGTAIGMGRVDSLGMNGSTRGPGSGESAVGEGVVVSRRRGQISSMWGQLAAIRCWESWKDRAWGNQVFEWMRDKIELSSLVHLQVLCMTPRGGR